MLGVRLTRVLFEFRGLRFGYMQRSRKTIRFLSHVHPYRNARAISYYICQLIRELAVTSMHNIIFCM